MKKNLNTEERLVRLALAFVFFLYAWWQSSFLGLLLGTFTFFEAIASWCAFYQLLGKNRCPIEVKQHSKENLQNLDPKQLGFAGGILCGLSVMLLTFLSILTSYGKEWLILISEIFPGYTLTWKGGLVGLVDAFIVAFFAMFFLISIYNALKKIV